MSISRFPTTVVGSWPRSEAVQAAFRDRHAGRISDQDFQTVADDAVRAVVRAQEEAGVTMVSDGEQRRDNFISFVAAALDNVEMMTVSEMLPYVEDKAGFEEILGTLDVPAFALRNPVAVGRINRGRSIAQSEVAFLRSVTDRPIKVALPGPYLLTRAMWVEGLTGPFYPTKEDLADDVVRVLREEVRDLIDSGVAMVQLDEPVLTELVFTQKNAHRTFMCGALSAKADAEQELEFATHLINGVVEDLSHDGVTLGVHVCRGNWSRHEEVLLRGSYAPLIPYLSQLKVDQLVLEFATERAGSMALLADLPQGIGLGVVNPRTDRVETVDEVMKRVREAAQYTDPGRLFLNPDCGFGTFSQRPMNSATVAQAKLSVMQQAAMRLRG
ncbi:cobalamin-independent methionine synthase II family protein [Sulfobacillus harzensis]|uniref:Cobalamin-independent methionine synthase II family protein n=1 Tax=Sulfobacillus harzensis TaxID=2729629 RepID=A0A7Y0L4H3_9FIRM|nr:cobalamin-independent methionine synthase II family protein [Sulfobacillus harzensis]